MCEINEIIVIDKDSLDSFDPHGYCGESSRPELNFKSPTKRSFLNECIRQIYILNGNDMPMMSIPVEYNRCLILNTLNRLVIPQRISHYQASVQRVKRRLFREPKQKQRKSKQITRNAITETECYFYKPGRSLLGIRKIPRNYLDEARRQINLQRRQNLKRKLGSDDLNESLHLSTKDGVFQVSQQVISKVCRYHGNMARNHPQRERSMEEQIKRERNTEACRLSRRAKKLEEMLVEQQYRERAMANEKVLEASIRSILYMKALMGLMVAGGGGVQDERNLYI